MIGISVLNLMNAYNISYEEAQILQYKILLIMLLVVGILYALSKIIERFFPNLYKKLEAKNIL